MLHWFGQKTGNTTGPSWPTGLVGTTPDLLNPEYEKTGKHDRFNQSRPESERLEHNKSSVLRL
jgi:hypothetical protein